MIYAGFWVRAAAYIMDLVLVSLMLLIVRLVMSVSMSALGGTVLGGPLLFHYTLKDIVLYLAQVLYFVLCTYVSGTTIGKKAMNLQVVSAEKEEKLTLLNVIYRETIGRFLCGIFVGIGYLLVGIDKEKRGIHDMLCDTRVVYTKKIKIDPRYTPIPVPSAPPVQWDSQGLSGGNPMPPAPPASQSGPYRMVRPEEQSIPQRIPEDFSYRPAEPYPDAGASMSGQERLENRSEVCPGPEEAAKYQKEFIQQERNNKIEGDS